MNTIALHVIFNVVSITVPTYSCYCSFAFHCIGPNVGVKGLNINLTNGSAVNVIALMTYDKSSIQ
jgi:hypothetical protein